MAIDELHDFVGEWEMQVDLPGAENVRGHVVFEMLGELLVQRTTVPVPEAYDGRTWTLERTKPDFTPLEFSQRYVGRFADDRSEITGEWQSSPDGNAWSKDFGLMLRRARHPTRGRG